MLPEFPQFKKLELTDRQDVEALASQFSPYSDFNFVSMWSWDVHGEIKLSQLNNNLVICLSDYLTGGPAYSFLGKNQLNETAQKVLALAKSETIQGALKYIPEPVALGLDTQVFNVQADRDHFDYIYSLGELALLQGNKFQSRRGFVNRFLRQYPEHVLTHIDLQDVSVQEQIIELNRTWKENKREASKEPQSESESVALERLFAAAKESSITCTGLFVDKRLAAFAIDEHLQNSDYVLGHFLKADERVVGSFPYVLQKSSAFFFDQGKKLFNFEQDLGLPGLRQSKLAFRPISYLKKYKVSLLP